MSIILIYTVTGVTILCNSAEVGDSGTVNSVTYTKRSKGQVTVDNAVTTCTSGISGITDMSSMFSGVDAFNQDIGSWDVSSVLTSLDMLDADTFNQDLSDWCVNSITSQPLNFRIRSPLTDDHSPNWGADC